MELEIKIHKDECWWGGSVSDGWKMPITEKSEYFLDCTINRTYNQFNGFFVSTTGRYIHFNGGAKIQAKNGILKISETVDCIHFCEDYKNLKEAYCAASKKYFSVPKSKFDINFVNPMYCTWMEMLTNPTQEKIVQYAESIIEQNLKKSCIIIDDGWMYDYGDWRFDKKKFPNPKALVDQLHELGFKVMLWIVPFVNFECAEFNILQKKNALLKDNHGQIAKVEWWNGKSAVLDMTSVEAYTWIKNILNGLQKDYGIDYFKFDAGDAMYYEVYEDISKANEQSKLWAELAFEYPNSELRACVGGGGVPVLQRLSDKRSDWDNEGLGGLIGNVIQAGLCGYSYVCADMIGGGQSADFKKMSQMENEFFIRSCQMATLFPIMQFSSAVWTKGERINNTVKKCCEIRKKYQDYICSLFENANVNFEPIVRPIVYEFPDYSGECSDCFMLGDKYLVAPIKTPGQKEYKIKLPEAKWKFIDGSIIQGGVEVKMETDLDTLLIFERL